ncbi:PLDc N-terminal domain-containing protein [Sphingobacterium kyonggiense]|uniref:PLDc N-terminal domain-containing protein n=1 Tax=Sphingobacterium kyonggiense TaxID=714075 RepID=UPI003CD0B07F
MKSFGTIQALSSSISFNLFFWQLLCIIHLIILIGCIIHIAKNHKIQGFSTPLWVLVMIIFPIVGCIGYLIYNNRLHKTIVQN